MPAHVTRIVSIVLLAVVLAAATGCSRRTEPTTKPVILAEPTASASTTPAESAGPVTTPAAGSATRAAVLKAASLGLGVSGNLTVYQLFVQDGAAVGDVLPAGGTRTFFALTGGPDAWDLVWSAPFGSKLAGAGALVKAEPGVSAELAAALDYDKTVKKSAIKPAAPTLASFETFALKSAKSFAGTTYTGEFTVRAKIAKDSTGAWWGNAIVEPSDEEGLEALGVWGRYSGGAWTGEIADFSTEGADAGFFPPDVLAKLAL